MPTCVMFFVITCLAILWATNIAQFMLMYFLKCIGMCFIGAVGYAMQRSSKPLKEARSVKMTDLTANVSLITPLLGPFVASIQVEAWKIMFVFVLILGAFSFIGLWQTISETAVLKEEKLFFAVVAFD